MRRLTGLALVLIMLVMTLPVLACAMTPKLTRLEQNCCQGMRGTCGDVGRQACCQAEVPSDRNQLPTEVVAAPILPLITIAVLYPSLVHPPAMFGYGRQLPEEHWPPGLLIAATTVLQI